MAPILLDATTDAITTNLNSLWLMVAAALVLLMTPGVAFFYGGMVKAKSVISMMMMSFGAIALVAVLFVLYGYSMAFSQGSGWIIHGVIGNPFASFALIPELTSGAGGGANLNSLAFAGFQATFAIITDRKS
ncbi:MAG: ammonium transporter, partial [Acidobacteria bacterium]|nr:ammonium transporter [Acidobacteriota bacterium]